MPSALPDPATALLGTEKAALSRGLAHGHRAQAAEGPLSATGRVLGGLGTGLWVWWGQEWYKESERPREAARVGVVTAGGRAAKAPRLILRGGRWLGEELRP